MNGHLRLELVPDPYGRTAIGAQSFHAPMHLSKPHWDGRYLIVQLVNCTAGLFSGDRIELAIQAKSGTSAILTSPSAQRAYQARESGSFAEVEQSFSVAADAWLEVCPEIFIPQQGSRVRQRTRIDIAPTSGLFFIESLAPGRVGSAESFAFDQLDWTTELFVDGELLSRERYRLSPEEDGIKSLRHYRSDAYYASCYLAFPELSGEFCREIATIHEAHCEIAASLLSPGIVTIKLLASDSMSLRAGINRVREFCYAARKKPLPAWRKL